MTLLFRCATHIRGLALGQFVIWLISLNFAHLGILHNRTGGPLRTALGWPFKVLWYCPGVRCIRHIRHVIPGISGISIHAQRQQDRSGSSVTHRRIRVSRELLMTDRVDNEPSANNTYMYEKLRMFWNLNPGADCEMSSERGAVWIDSTSTYGPSAMQVYNRRRVELLAVFSNSILVHPPSCGLLRWWWLLFACTHAILSLYMSFVSTVSHLSIITDRC